VEEKGRVAVILVVGRRKLGLALTIERRKSCIFAGCVGLVLGIGVMRGCGIWLMGLLVV
jgi:hypothetical protein